MAAGTGNDEVADAGKPVKSLNLRSHGHSKTGDFGDTSGNQSRFRVVAVAQTVRRSCCQSNDVLKGTAQLHAQDIRVCVDTEDGAHEDLL